MLASGRDVNSFHASEDTQEVRNLVFEKFHSFVHLKAHIITGKKSLFSDDFHNSAEIHRYFSTYLISAIMNSYESSGLRAVVILFDQAFTKKIQGEFRTGIKPIIKPYRKTFHLYFQSMKTEMNGQIADYVAWAKFKALERGDLRAWDAVRQALNPIEIDLTPTS
jgi:hypothetical protein